MEKKEPIKVLIIDDSAVVRETMKKLLDSDPTIEVIATAIDPMIAIQKIKRQKPDVITLDIEMPRMDGITFLEQLMSTQPIPVVICSSLAEQGSETLLRAIELGAVEIIQKPLLGTQEFLIESRVRLTDAIKSAASANLNKITSMIQKRKLNHTNPVDHTNSRIVSDAMVKTTDKVVVIGASTGGTEAIRILLESLPHDSPGIVIVQHMPEVFTKSFAKRLDSMCTISIKEAENNDTVIRGRALIAPGNYHTVLKRSGARYYVEIKTGPLVTRHRPSVNVLFKSTAKFVGPNAVGIILTGMGDDGAEGMQELKQAGAYTIAQDEESSVVFGMPKEAIKRGCVDKILGLEKISRHILSICK